MRKISLRLTLVIVLGVLSGCYMVKNIPKEKIGTYPSITDLYFDKYGAHGKLESAPGEPFKLSLTIYRDTRERAEDFLFTTGEYCNAIGGKLQSSGNEFTCSRSTDPNEVLFVTRCKVTKAFRTAGDSSEKALMEIWVTQNNNSKAFDLEKGSLPDSRPGQNRQGLTPADLRYMESLGLGGKK